MEHSSFFNSINGDRRYLASDYAKYFSLFIGNGVFPNPSTNLQVIANNDMTVTVKAGPGWINGYMYINDSDLILPIDAADGVLNRIDRLVLRMDTVGRVINVVVKKGTFASSPVASTLQRDADGYELGLADVYVAAGATQITQANITDLRLDNNFCGVVHGTVDQIDLTTLFNQYTEGFQEKEQQFTDDFQAWFDTIKNQLSGDVAGNLQNQINTLNDTVASDKADYVSQPAKVTATSSNNVYTITAPSISAYVDCIGFVLKADSDSTGAVTANWDGKGAKALKKANGNDVTLKNGGIYTFRYNITTGNFILQGEGGSGNATASDLLSGKTATTDAGDIVGTMDLQAQNIKKGIIYGGIAGTLPYLPADYINAHLYKTATMSGSTNVSTHMTYTVDNTVLYYIDETAGSYNIYKYDILNKVSTNLGKGSWTATPVNICCSDDGSIIYVVTNTGQIWYYAGSTWTNTNQVAMTSVNDFPVICCNSDGSEIYFITGTNDSIGDALKKWIKATATVTTVLAIDHIYANYNWLMNWTSDGAIWLTINGSPLTYKRIKITDGSILNSINNPAAFGRTGKGFRDASKSIIGVLQGSPTGAAGNDYIYLINSNNTTTQTSYASPYGGSTLAISPRGEFQIWVYSSYYYFLALKNGVSVIFQALSSNFAGMPIICSEDGWRWVANSNAMNSYYSYQ